MLARLTRLAVSAPKRVLAVAFLLLVLCGIYGASASQHLLAGGYSDPNSESAQAAQQINDTFQRGGLQVVLKLDAPAGTDTEKDPRAAAVGKSLVTELDGIPYVQQPILSVWQDPTLAPGLVSKDRSSALIIATLDGGEADAPAHAKEVASRFEGTRDGISIRVGGEGLVFQQVNEQTTRDLALAEGIAIPISFLVLIVVFGGVLAAMLPIGVGIIAIVLTFALLRLIGTVTDVSIFALNLTTAMGLALAIDYTLLLVTRYREEVADGRDRRSAILRTMSTAGRTVAFSAITVALALAALAIFPMYFLRSFAYAGLGVVAIAAVTSLVITPAALMLLGDRIDSLDVRRGVCKLLGRPEPTPRPVEQGWWYRAASWVLKRAAPVGATVVAILLVLGAPFLSIKFGFPDDRVLPTSASAHQIQQEIRDDFAQNLSSTITVVTTGDVSQQTRAHYAQELSRVADVNSVSGAGGTFVDGRPVGPVNPADLRGDVGVITIATSLEPMQEAGEHQLAQLRDVPAPDGLTAKFTGTAATNVDTVDSIYAHLPWVLGVIAIATFILLFLFTGSVVLPLKALVLNVLSLSATFGAMVWFFQEGHLGGLGTTATGYLAATMPVLMFCIAFGLSIDYEVFLLGRIRESWLSSDRSRAANDRAVALGIARTGRVITAAALLMSIVFAGIAASEVSFMRMFGVGLTLAVLMDATLIRMLLVPSFMRLAGRVNWWAPAPLRRVHDRFGLSEEVDDEQRGSHARPDANPTHEIETQENSDADLSQDPIAPRIR